MNLLLITCLTAHGFALQSWTAHENATYWPWLSWPLAAWPALALTFVFWVEGLFTMRAANVNPAGLAGTRCGVNFGAALLLTYTAKPGVSVAPVGIMLVALCFGDAVLELASLWHTGFTTPRGAHTKFRARFRTFVPFSRDALACHAPGPRTSVSSAGITSNPAVCVDASRSARWGDSTSHAV